MKRTKGIGKHFPLGAAFSTALFMGFMAAVLTFACKNQHVSTVDTTPKVNVEFGVDEIGGIKPGELKAKAGGRDLISPCILDKGTEITFKAEASGKKFFLKGWTNNGTAVNGSNEEYKVKAERDMTVKAVFQKLKEGQCKVTFSPLSPNGRLKAHDGTGEIVSPAGVNSGTEVTFTAEPHAGYKAGIWTKDNVAVDNSGNTYKLTVTDDVFVRVSFIPESVESYNVRFDLDGTGASLKASTIIGGIEIPFTSPAKLPAHTEVMFKATLEDPANFYVEWDGAAEAGTEGAVSKAVLTVTGEANVICKVKPKTEDEILVRFGAKGGTGGKVKAELNNKEITSPYTAKTGDKIKFTAEPDTQNNYQFVNWEGALPDSSNKLVAEVTVGKAPVNVFAVFKQYVQISFGVTGDTSRGTLSVRSASSPGTDLVSPYNAVVGEKLSLTASPADLVKYTVKWTDFEGLNVDPANNRMATLTVMKTGTVNVEFIERPSALVKVKITGDGNLDRSSSLSYTGDWAGRMFEDKYYFYNLVKGEEPGFDENSVIGEAGKRIYVDGQLALSLRSSEDSEEPAVTAEGSDIEKQFNGSYNITVKGETVITIDVKKKPMFDISFATDGENKDKGTIYMRGKQKEGSWHEFEKLTESPQKVYKDKHVTLTAEPQRGWKVEKWVKDSNELADETGNSYSFTAEAQADYKVHFASNEANKFSIMLKAEGDGEVKAAADGTDISISGNNGDIYKGERLNIKAIPQDGKMVESWTVKHNDKDITVNNSWETGDPPLSFEIYSVEGNVEVTVKFKETPSYEVKFAAASGGGGSVKLVKLNEQVQPDGTVTVQEEVLDSSPQTIPHGTKVEFRAEPESGYRVEKWEGITAQGINKARTRVRSAYNVTVTFKSENAAGNDTDIMVPLRFTDVVMPTGGSFNGSISEDANSYSLKKPFEIGKYEVTYELYKKVIDWTKTYNETKTKDKSDAEITEMRKKHEIYHFNYEVTWNPGTVNEQKEVHDNRGAAGSPVFNSADQLNDFIAPDKWKENTAKLVGVEVTEDNKNQPAVFMEYTAALVWCNAYSEMCGFEPYYNVQYRDDDDYNNIINVSGVLRSVQISPMATTQPRYIYPNENSCGYRLPTTMEWELAARLSTAVHGDNTFSDKKCTVNGTEYFFTKGFVPSGAHKSVAIDGYTKEVEDEYRRVGRFLSAATAEAFIAKYPAGTVKVNDSQYAPNDLGLMHMSGNVMEYVWHPEFGMKGLMFFYKGGDWYSDWVILCLGDVYSEAATVCQLNVGFRLCRTLD